MNDRGLKHVDGLRQALAVAYVLPQMNSSPTVAGYSPTQWVLGYQPDFAGDLTSEGLNPSHLDGANFEQTLEKRSAAKVALIKADQDQRLRRALRICRYSGTNMILQPGQICWYWRDARAADLAKVRWKGPARAILREDDAEGKPIVYWIAHQTQLLRCAPRHVRADYRVASDTNIGGLEEARRVVSELKSRGVTRFVDLQRANKRHIGEVQSDEEELFDDDDDDDGGGGDDDDDDDADGAPGPPRQRPRLDLWTLWNGLTLTCHLLQRLHWVTLGQPWTWRAWTYLRLDPHKMLLILVDLPSLLVITLMSWCLLLQVGRYDHHVQLQMNLNLVRGHPDHLQCDLRHLCWPWTRHAGDVRACRSKWSISTSTTSTWTTWNLGVALTNQKSSLSVSTSSWSRWCRSNFCYYKPSACFCWWDSWELYPQVFNVEDIQGDDLPSGWHVGSDGAFVLKDVLHDFWEAGCHCLIRHNIAPRRNAMNIHDYKDVPIEPKYSISINSDHHDALSWRKPEDPQRWCQPGYLYFNFLDWRHCVPDHWSSQAWTWHVCQSYCQEDWSWPQDQGQEN